MVGILTGLSAGDKERGKIFGIISLTGGLGALVGGLGVGWLVEHWGYTTMFDVMAIFLFLWPISAWFVEDKYPTRSQAEDTLEQKIPGLGKNFYLLFAANTLSAFTGFFIVLIRSFAMSELGFGALEISSTGAIGGLIAMPLPVLMGWLSDRMGRKTFLYVGFLLVFASLVMLAFSRVLWHFWIVFVFQGIAMQGNGTIGNALVTDLVRRDSFGKGLALFGATGWIGGVVGFAVAGYSLQNLGSAATFFIGGALALVALGLLIPIRAKPHQ